MTPSDQARAILQDTVSAGVKTAPPTVLTLWNTLAATPAEKWLTYLTIAYVVLQFGLLIRDKIVRDRNASDRGEK